MPSVCHLYVACLSYGPGTDLLSIHQIDTTADKRRKIARQQQPSKNIDRQSTSAVLKIKSNPIKNLPKMAEEQPEEVKVEARQFMSDLVSTAASEQTVDDATPGKSIDMAAWKAIYGSSSQKDDPAGIMQQFWTLYDPNATSIWKMVYDEADSNENLDETIEIVSALMKKTETEEMKKYCFGVVHTLENLEIEGIWVFNGPDPEHLFGTNDDTSWFTWSQLGPDANDYVQEAVGNLMATTGGTLNGKIIKNTQAFC